MFSFLLLLVILNHVFLLRLRILMRWISEVRIETIDMAWQVRISLCLLYFFYQVYAYYKICFSKVIKSFLSPTKI